MKKILVTLLIVICCLCLFSCNLIVKNNTDPNKPNKPNNPNTSTEGTIFIVPSTDGEWNSTEFVNSLFGVWDKMPVVINESTEKSGNELVIGKTEREVSKKAYLQLNRLLEDNPGINGWLVYYLDGSICLAYDSKLSAELACEYFTANLLDFPTLNIKNGVYQKEIYDINDKADVERAIKREEGFKRLEATLGNEAVNHLRNLYALFVPELYIWQVNLYDPEIGGIYYSNSARNNEGFLPDLESTVQGFSLLADVSILPNGYTNDLPDEIKAKMLEFAISLQAEDGYFYHPQWGSNIKTSRRSRDLGWAMRIIDGLGGTPKYPYPGEKIDLYSTSGPLTRRIGEDSVIAASHAIAATSTLPSHLQSLEAFEAYLDSKDFKTNSYQAGNDLAAQNREIRAAGQEYIDFLIKYLSERQNPENGLWEDTVTYSSVNGLMKLGSIFWYYNAVMPYAEEALNSAIEITLHPDLGEFSSSDVHVCSVYNPWISMSYVLEAVQASEGYDAMLALRQILLNKAPELIEMTTKKIAPFRKPDGGFSYLKDTCSPGSQGVPTAIECEESDVNGTAIASTGITDTMENVFGVILPDYFYEIDRQIAMEELLGLGSVIKVEAPKTEPESFDDWTEDLIKAETQNGVIQDLGPTSYTNVSDGELDENYNYKWFSTTITQNPKEPEGTEDLVLKANTFLRPDEEKTKADTASSIRFNVVPSSRVGSCYVFDADILVSSSEGTSTVGQLFFFSKNNSNAFSINFNKYSAGGKQYLRIGENYQGLDGKKDGNIADKILVGDWFNFKIEIYRGRDADLNVTVDALIYINGEYQGWCDAGWVLGTNTYFSENPIDVASFSCYRHNESEIYFNNVLVERIKKDYVAPPERPLNDGIYDFTDEPIGESCPDGADTIVQGGEMAVINLNGNKVFRFNDTSSSKSNAFKFNLSEILVEGANAYLFESELIINSTTNNDMNFGFLNEKGSIMLNTTVTLTENGDKYDLIVSTKTNIDEKDGIRLVKTRVDKTFRFAIAYFPDLSAFNIIVNDKVVAESDALYEQNNMNVGTSWFWSSGASVMDAYFDNIKVVPAILAYTVPEEDDDINTPYYGIYNFEK